MDFVLKTKLEWISICGISTLPLWDLKRLAWNVFIRFVRTGLDDYKKIDGAITDLHLMKL